MVSYEVAASSGQVGAPASVTNTVQTVTSLAVSGTAALAVGQTSQVTATATLSNGTTQNVTSSATWQSSNAAVATVSSGGLVTAVAAGTATIMATSQGKSGTLTITVTVSTLQLTGVWNVSSINTNATGSCANHLNKTFQGQVSVSSSGSFTFLIGTGTMNLASGAWSFSGSTGGCPTTDPTETFSGSGTCSSSTACSGTSSGTSSPSGGTESATIIWSR